MKFTTISSGVVLILFWIPFAFVRELFGFHWENPEESRRNVEQILDQYAMKAEDGWEKRRRRVGKIKGLDFHPCL